MVLLEVLHRLAPLHRWQLSVAHFNHQLRGRASDADERLVRATAKRLRLPCVVDRADVRRLASEQKISVEMAARQARHGFLARTARSHGTSVIAVAHHADDQVELFFLRLLRGAGARGLAGMKWTNPSPADNSVTLVRPLLDCFKVDLAGFASEARVRFREDATNASADILRNRIRHELLRLLKKSYQPALDTVVLRQMTILSAESECLNEIIEAWRRDPTTPFNELAVALQRRILHGALVAHGIDAEFEMVEQLRRSPGRPVMVSAGFVAMHDGHGRIHRAEAQPVAFNEAQVVLNLKGRKGQGVFDGVDWDWRLVPIGNARRPEFSTGTEWFDADKIGPTVVLRHWQRGDRFQPAGMSKAVKLQDLFTNQKVARAIRHRVLVAATGSGEIWWVEGLRIGEQFKLTDATQRRLKWNWSRREAGEATKSRKSDTRR